MNRIGFVWFLAIGLLILSSPLAVAQPFMVTNSNDSGAGSLRQAILNANASPNGGQPDEIHFAIDAQPPPIQEPTMLFSAMGFTETVA